MNESNQHTHPATRRAFIGGMLAGAVGGAAIGAGAPYLLGQSGRSSQLPAPGSAELGIPGPYPGRVIEVAHDGCVAGGRRDREAVAAMVGRGMTELVGCDEPVEAWRRFFQPGDRVGIKVVPVGKPLAISSPEVIWAVIDGLKSAGVRPRDIMVFERYRNEFFDAGYLEWMPTDMHWEASSVEYDNSQLELDGQRPGSRGKPRPPRMDHVAGYDRDEFRELDFCMDPPHHDPKDDRRFRRSVGSSVRHPRRRRETVSGTIPHPSAAARSARRHTRPRRLRQGRPAVRAPVGAAGLTALFSKEGGNVSKKQQLIDGLNDDLNLELEAVLRYLYHTATATGLLGHELRELLKGEIAGELNHAVFLADKIVALGGDPKIKPAMPKAVDNARQMLAEDIAAERKAVANYTERIAQAEAFGDKGLVIRLEDMLAEETDHAEELERLGR